MLGALSSRSALSVLVGVLLKKFGLFLNTPRNPFLPSQSCGNFISVLEIKVSTGIFNFRHKNKTLIKRQAEECLYLKNKIFAVKRKNQRSNCKTL
jgi:hypothetical protein